ncbi:Calcium-binding protein [Nymphaea thermarum]|nr:Calcium-binding protein [Nymphaea thermarum]
MQEQGSPSKPRSPLRRFCEKIFPNGAKADREQTSGTPSASPRRSDCSSPARRSGDLERVFGFFDSDGDGRISPAELRSCMRTMGEDWTEEEATTALGFIDSDGDGHVGFDDFVRLMADGRGEEAGGSGGESRQREDIRAAFSMYAVEGRECITPRSLRRMLKRLGDSRSVAECRAMIRRFDIDGDGVLSLDEFNHMMMA